MCHFRKLHLIMSKLLTERADEVNIITEHINLGFIKTDRVKCVYLHKCVYKIEQKCV